MDTMRGSLACPVTRLPVREVPLEDARRAITGGRPLATRKSGKAPIGETATVMLRQDDKAAYPVVRGFPVMLGPEMLTAEPTYFDLAHSHYAEAYSETEFYDAEASAKAAELRNGSLDQSTSEILRWLASMARRPQIELADFPRPERLWVNDRMDLGANVDCLQHIGSVKGQRVLQLGGTGGMLATFMLAGAAEGWLVTPMVGEAELAQAVARAVGKEISCVVGIAEEVPLLAQSVDVVYSGGCVHHMTTELAMPDIARVLRPGGRFAAIEPWRAPLYAIGTRLFGKREANAFCRPLNPERVAPLYSAFSTARIVQHGTFLRYPMLAAEKLGARFPLSSCWHIGKLDDRLSSMTGLRRFGSSVALLGAKPGQSA
jgi:ubiquinone/menaquinone biosynthesis C-methylase UbiE/uncharacterized protein YbaR (Trm112 family)